MLTPPTLGGRPRRSHDVRRHRQAPRPLVDAEGRDAVAGFVTAVREQFPGLTFRLAGPVDAHHDVARFTWTLGPDEGEPPVVGFDAAVLEDGRVRAVHGFLDKVPAA